MDPDCIIYYGEAGLQADVLAAYLAKLGFCFMRVSSVSSLVDAVRAQGSPLVVLALNSSPPVLISIARQVVEDVWDAFPHVFILYPGSPFDAQLESVTVIAGARRFAHLEKQLRPFLRR